MSQNSIITTVILILAIIVGVYFYFTSSSESSHTTDYNDTSTSNRNDSLANSDSSNSIARSPSNSVVSEPTPLPEPSTTDSTTSESSEKTITSSGTSSTAPVVPPEPVIIKYTYTVNIKGAVTKDKLPFVIKAIAMDGSGEDFAQENLVDGEYKFESLKVFNSISINVADYSPVLKENLTLTGTSIVIDVEMEAYAIISGDVKSFSEKPIGGAALLVEGSGYKKMIHSNTQGEFKLGEKIPAGQYNVTINHPQYDSKKMVVELAKGEEKVVSVKLERDAIFDGVIKTFEDKPAANITVDLKNDSDASKSKSFTTDANGSFQLTKIQEGKYSLVINNDLGSLVESLAFAKNIEMVREFKMLPPPSVSGVLVDENGKAVSGVKLFTFDDKNIIEDVTKEDGKFKLVLIKKGNYRVLTNSEDYEIINTTKLYTPSLDKEVIQVKKKVFLKGKILSTSGVVVNKDVTLKIVNLTKKTQIGIFGFKFKDNKVLIPIATFKFISPEDEIQIAVNSTSYGKGLSLTMKVGSLTEENEFIVTLGD
jgi:hypothetical protein